MSEDTAETAPEKKAYDLKDLGKKLKDEGLELAEDAAAKVVKCTLAWLKESAALSPNKMDDLVAPLLTPLEAYVLEQVDKIDGQPG